MILVGAILRDREIWTHGLDNATEFANARHTLKEIFDAASNHHSSVVVRRRRGLLRLFKVGDRWRPWSRRHGPAHRFGGVSAWRLALTSRIGDRDQIVSAELHERSGSSPCGVPNRHSNRERLRDGAYYRSAFSFVLKSPGFSQLVPVIGMYEM